MGSSTPASNPAPGPALVSNHTPVFPPGQTLLIDADDTLWENNIYFERAIADFISYLDHQHHSRQQVRERLNQVERETVAAHGYGLVSFRRSLVTCFEQLRGSPASPEDVQTIQGFADSIADAAIELLPGVAEALPPLAARHRLVLMTKGNPVEQCGKLERSGMGCHFQAVEVPREKDPGAYARVLAQHELAPDATWMIGNSPKSDINPALAAGLHAVFIRHPHTWVLEDEHLAGPAPGRHLLELESFGDLIRFF